jgi:hypothetical protein
LAERALLAERKSLLAGCGELLSPLALLEDGVFEGGGQRGDVGAARNEGEVAGEFGQAVQTGAEPLFEVGRSGGEVVDGEGIAAAWEQLAVGLWQGRMRELL